MKSDQGHRETATSSQLNREWQIALEKAEGLITLGLSYSLTQGNEISIGNTHLSLDLSAFLEVKDMLLSLRDSTLL